VILLRIFPLALAGLATSGCSSAPATKPDTEEPSRPTLREQLIAEWGIDGSRRGLSLKFKSDGTFSEEVEVFHPGDGVITPDTTYRYDEGRYDWIDEQNIRLTKPGKAAQQYKVVIQEKNLTLIGEDGSVRRGKRRQRFASPAGEAQLLYSNAEEPSCLTQPT
jgi:hypothetical protein